MDILQMEKKSREMRLEIAKILSRVNGSHIGGAYSVLDILNVLYFKIMNINPEDPLMPTRDKLIFSKGHAGIALYTVLSNRGFFSKEMLNSYCKNNSPLEGHVNYFNVPGIEVSTGSLGHGLAVGAGMALSNKNERNKGKVFVILSDGECQEGSVWEAAIFISRMQLDNLAVIVDANGWQGYDSTENIFGGERKLIELWQSSGFAIKEIDGHDYKQISHALENLPIKKNRPSLIYANTIKGKGVSFMEDKLEWHYKSPKEEDIGVIEKELGQR